jgi:release factor glutamine methyltransferase
MDRVWAMTEIMAGATIDAARRALAVRFAAAALDTPELDARLLVGHALGLDLTGLVTHGSRRLRPDEAQQLERLAERRLSGEPVARILGTKEFWGLPLMLSSDTLVPRPDTETVVELALDYLSAGGDQKRPLRIADLGTGSGAILLALLSELPQGFGVGTDISIGALRTAQANARALGLAQRAGFVACSYAAALSGPLDLIVSNPPYIPAADIVGLAVEVCAHDPRRALDGGADGLEAYRSLIPEAASLLQPGGALVVEVGLNQSSAVQAMMADAGLQTDSSSIRADLTGIPRAVLALKKVR